QHVATTELARLFDALGDQPRAGWALWVAVDQRAAVVVERLGLDLERAGKEQIVDREWVVGLDDLDVADADARFAQCLPGGRDHRLGHVALLDAGLRVAVHADRRRAIAGPRG